MQQVGQRPADSKQWTTGTAGWGQTRSDSDVDWTQAPPVSSPGHANTTTSGKVLWPSSGESDSTSESGGAAKVGTVNVTPSSKSSDSNSDKSQSTSAMANLSASISWGPSSSTPGGLDSSMWGGMNTSSSSTNPTWGSSTAPTLSLNSGHSMQIGASSVGDTQNTNGSASAAGWGMSPMNQNGAALPGNMSQSQAGSVPGSNLGQQSGPSTLASNQSGPLGSSALQWQNSKSFGFTQASDSNWSSPSTAVVSSTSTSSKDTSGNITTTLADPGKMDLAAGIANLAIDKTAPPPDWNAMKSGWNSAMDTSKQSVGGVGSPADLSFAQATQKGLKPAISTIRGGMLSAKDEEIRRAVNTNEGWGTRPVRQDTSWDIESSPKAARKVIADNPEVAASNVWNNNNGTAIWESTRENPNPGWGGGAAAGGAIFADKDPNAWNMPPKGNMDGGNWGGNGPNNSMMNNPMSDKSIGTWGGESQQSSNKLWGNNTETGSWNEPPPERNMTWAGQDTDVGTWEDPATAAARRIVSSSGVGPINMGGSSNNMNMGNNTMPVGNNMGMGGSNMGMGGNNLPMGGSNMPMGGGNMPMGGSNMPMGSSNLPMGSSNLPMGSGSGMSGNMNMSLAGGGNGMNMASGSGMGNNNMNMPMSGGSNMNMPGGGDSMYWNDPNAKSQGWNQASGPPRPKPDESWTKGNVVRPGGSNGWGDPSGNSSQKVDDGTSIWAANAQEQARAAGWGEPGAMWNPAFGARPKSTSWTGGDQDNWQRKLGQQRFPGSGGQPQMRSKLIQQLMDMGFKKEEAQTALISNNMNFESALGELTSGLHKKELDNDVFQANGSKMMRQGFLGENSGMMGDDISDNRQDSNPHVPNFPMQNTPFNNAQVPNQSYMSGGVNMYDRSKAGPPMPPNNNGNMNNNLQHKLKMMQQQGGNTAPAMNSLSPTQVRGTVVPNTNNQSMVQQQAAQQQILQQLRLAVQSGLISPQLLNYQLPHNILVMLQQLLQLQNALQTLLQRQQYLQQNKVTLNVPRVQLEQASVMINQYRSQIMTIQKQIQVAQQSMLVKQQPPSAPTPTPSQMQAMTQQPHMGMPPPLPTSMQSEGGESILSLPSEMNSMSGGGSNNSMSRLNQWKQPTSEKDGQADLSKAPGSKPPQGLQHSHSTPVMGPFGDLTSLNIGGDTTWSSSATSSASNWPSSSAESGSGDRKSDDGTPPSSGLASMLGGGGNLGLSTDVIPEFVPGKPWQGLSSKSVEDDPHITPGSISRSLSVNVVKDDYLNNLTANKSSPSFSTDATWSTGKLGNSAAETSMASAMSQGAFNLQAQQNRAGNNGMWQGASGFNRQHSWAGRSPGSAFTQVSGSGWEGRQSSSWLPKNLSTQDEEQ